MDANAMRQKVLALIAEYSTDEAKRQEVEKAEMGRDYDMNSYGAGYDVGLQAAANQIAEMITDLDADEPVALTDDTAVTQFAYAMRSKMEVSRNKGRGGWQTCQTAVLWQALRDHVEKGDPVDVANLAMMIWHNERA